MKNLPLFGVSHLEKFLAHLDVDGGARVDGTFQLQSERVDHLRGGLTYKSRPGKLVGGNSTHFLNARPCCGFPGGTRRSQRRARTRSTRTRCRLRPCSTWGTCRRRRRSPSSAHRYRGHTSDGPLDPGNLKIILEKLKAKFLNIKLKLNTCGDLSRERPPTLVVLPRPIFHRSVTQMEAGIASET